MKKDMREYVREQCELAQAYANDGAYHSAARVLYDAGNATKKHAMNVDDFTKRYMKSGGKTDD